MEETHQVDVVASSSVNTGTGAIKLHNVLYVPALQRNLMSVGSLIDDGRVIIFTKQQCLVFNNEKSNKVLAIGNHDITIGLYKFNDKAIEAKINTVTPEELWHRRFGHLHYAGLQHLSRAERVRGLPLFHVGKETCENCLARRQHRERFPKSSQHISTKVLQLIHSDLVGPIRTPSLNGSQYYVAFIDDLSRNSWFVVTDNIAIHKVSCT